MDDDSEMAESDSNLVYPKIQSIYSNINIKTEISDYEDNELEEMQLSDYETNEYLMPIPNKIILGTKPPTQQSEVNPEPSVSSVTTMMQDSFRCDECNIFFATQNDLDSHESAVHSFLVARSISSRKSPELSVASVHSFTEGSQDAVEPKLNNSFPVSNALNKKEVKNQDKFLCSHCNVNFPNEIELIKHTYELIPENVIRHLCGVCGRSFASPAELNFHQMTHKKKLVQKKLLRCNFCSLYTIQVGSLKNHLATNHNSSEVSLKPVSFKGKCPHCSRIFPNYRLFNKHMPKSHQKIYTSKKLLKHKEIKEVDVKNTVKPNVSLKVRKIVKPMPNLDLLKALASKNIVPKRALFKCNKCQFHFVACSQALAHSIQCFRSWKKPTWTCDKCGHTFRAIERHRHTLQHNFSDKFQVYTVNKGIYSKILCRCPRCKLYFGENDFWNHIAAKCEVQTAKTCDICKLKVSENFLPKHLINHRKYNHTKNDYILVEYVDAVNALGKDGDEKPVLYYCETCKTYMFQRKKRSKECVKISRKLCLTCGLLFTKKTIKKHVLKSHQLQNLKLQDYTFLRMSDGQVIDPPLPDFFSCSSCEVRFSCDEDVRRHDCQTQVSKPCKKCNGKFDDVTYKLHLDFHSYYESKANVKQENVSKILFSCTNCSYGFDHYDNLVSHCQDHFNNSTQVARAQKWCEVCNLLYSDPHGLHDSNFRVLCFKYDTLLTHRWWDGFGSVSNTVRDKILAESVYGLIRNLRLEVIIKGPSDRVLYKCMQCNVYFHTDAIVNHIAKGCSGNRPLTCESCHAAYYGSDALEEHSNIHVVYGDDIDFQEVGFNHPRDRNINNVLMKEIPKESLKFRKCSFCDHLVKKDDYQQHMDAHDCQQAEMCVSRIGVTYKLYPPKDGTQKRMYTLYKCIKCSHTMLYKGNIVRHNCSTDKGDKCSKCSQWIRKKFAKHHNAMHVKLPKFVNKNIKVIQFEVLNSKPIEKRKGAEKHEIETVSKDTDSPYESVKDKIDDDNNEDQAALSVVASKSEGYEKNYVQSEDTEDSEYVDVEENSDVPQEEELVEKRVNKEIVKFKLFPPKNGTQKRLYTVYNCRNCSQSIMYKFNIARHNCNKNKGTKCRKCSQWIRSYFVKKHAMLHKSLPKFLTKNINIIEFEIQRDSTQKISKKNIDNKLEEPVLEPQAVRPIECVEDKKDGVGDENERKGPYALRKSRAYNDRASEISEDPSFAQDEDTGDIDENLDLPNKNNMAIATKIYQCSHCDLSFITRKALIEHQLKCDETVEKPLVCKQCGFTFDSSNSSFHEHLHRLGQIGRIYAARISTKGIRVSDERNWLYKCDPCDAHYMTWKSLRRHLDNNHNTGVDFSPCDKCNLRFTSKSRSNHLKTQHTVEWCLENLNREMVEIKFIQLTSQDEVYDESTVESEDQTSNQAKFFITNPEGDHNLYRCTICDLNFLSKPSLDSHLRRSRHGIEKHTCYDCGLMFSASSMQRHVYVHHEIMKLKRQDLHITTWTGEEVDDDLEDEGEIADTIENANEIDESIKPSKIEGDEMNTEETSVDTDIVPLVKLKKSVRRLTNKRIVMYQCKDCNVCVKNAHIKQHVCFSNLKKKQCLQCSLTFARTDFLQHLRLHKRSELSRKNFILFKFGRFSNRNRVYKCVCSTHFLGLAAFECHMDRGKHDSDTVICDVCQLKFGKSSITRHLIVHHTRGKQFDIFSVRHVNESLEANKTSTMLESNASKEIKLFRCVECDVFFLTQDSYYQHMYKHTALDPTEFIECKMCQLPFLTESLADHMKTHKDKTFSLDHVVIESFDPTSGQCVTKGWGDNLAAKQVIVSTTTPFDDDEKNDEQQGTVDSTSDVNS